MFIGREMELAQLNSLYNSNKFELAVIYGRRRVGKTAIISEFIKDKDAIYFSGVETNEKHNLANFQRCILEYEGEDDTDTAFVSFKAALKHVFVESLKKRIVLVIDDYSCVARSSKNFMETLQLLIEQYKDNSKLLIILCASSMSYIENSVLSEKATLRDYITAQYKIQPLSFVEASEYFDNYGMVDKAVIYGIMGGIPQYLNQIDDDLSIEANIKNIYLNSSSLMHDELQNILKQEVREPAVYNTIINSIATGASKLSEIAEKMGEDTSVCATYIKNLLTLGIVRKETPFGDSSTRKTVYEIQDNELRFWYRFIPDNMSLISRGRTDQVYNIIKSQMSDYMSQVFRDICKQFLWEVLCKSGKSISYSDIGRWWGINPVTRKKEQIDIIVSTDSNTLFFGECKWIDKKVDVDVLDALIEKSRVFKQRNKYYYIFSKAGFTKECNEAAKSVGNVTLVSYK